MYSSTYRFTLDLHSTVSQISLPVTVGDTDRKLRISFSDGGIPFVIEDGCLAMVTVKRPYDEGIFQKFCTIENSSEVVFDFENVTKKVIENGETVTKTIGVVTDTGIYYCDVTLYDSENKVIASPKFILVATNRSYLGSDVEITSSDYDALDAIMAEERKRETAEINREGRVDIKISEMDIKINELENSKENGEFDGFSPVVTVTDITDGHRVTIQDKTKTSTFDIFDGEKGETGAQGPQGEKGDSGANGKSAYDYAKESGFQGTAEEFAEALAINANLTIYDGSVKISKMGG